jgi:hypothetical protein
MIDRSKHLGQLLTAREMKGIVGGEAPRRKYVCVICGPMDVHCMSVSATDKCEVLDHDPQIGNQGLGCKNDSMEDFSSVYHCP